MSKIEQSLRAEFLQRNFFDIEPFVTRCVLPKIDQNSHPIFQKAIGFFEIRETNRVVILFVKSF